jgi:peptide/nickel transport system substrate-binding protein
MDDRDLRMLIERVHQGGLERRQLIRHLAALGLGAPLANLMLMHRGIAQAPAPTPYKPTRRGGGGTLRLLLWQGPTLLNPHFATGSKDLQACRLFYESLARYDAEAKVVPVLAAEIPTRDNGGIAADGRSTTWKLRRGVTWHDGRPFTAADVVFNWRYAIDPTAATFYSGAYLLVKAVEEIDSHTVRIVFNEPTPLWGLTFTVQLIPKHVFEPFMGDKARQAPANLKPVGTGPYLFADFKPGDLVGGVINPTYHMPNRPHFDAVEIKGGGDATSAARAVMQTGEYHYAWNLAVEDEVLRRVEAGGKGRVVFSASGDVELIQLNMADPNKAVDGERANPKSRHPIFGDRTVRQAMSLLFDRTAAQQIWGRNGVATSNVIVNPPAFTSPNTRSEYSPERAEALLEAAGWKRGAGGVREKDGQRFSIVFQTSVNSVRQKVQSVYKQALAKAGIECEIKAVSPAVFFSSDAGNPDTHGKFWADLQMYAVGGRGPDPWRFLQWWAGWEVSSKANQWLGLNRGRWVNETYDALFKQQQAELDREKRAALIVRMNDLVCQDHAVIPVVYRPSVDAVARNLVAEISGWDDNLAAIHNWYRDGG